MRRRRLAWAVSVWAILISMAQAQEFGRDEKKLDLSDCPKAIQKAIRQEANKGKIGEVGLKKEDGVAIYTADVQLVDLKYVVIVRQDGVLLSKVLNGSDEAKTTKNGSDAVAGGEPEKQLSVKMANLPKKVQKILKQESRGGEIDDLVKVEKGNEVLYRAEAEIGDRDYKIELQDNGTLIKKVLVAAEERGAEDEDEDDDDD